jgi:hypothetical protein
MNGRRTVLSKELLVQGKLYEVRAGFQNECCKAVKARVRGSDAP